MALTGKQQAFITAYLECRNATEAAKRAGYSEDSAYQLGYKNMHHAEIKAAIEQHFAAVAMTAGEVLALFAEQARAKYAPYIKEDGSVDLGGLVRDGKAHLIKSIKKTKYGTNVEFHSVEGARETIARVHGLTDRGKSEEDPQHTVQWSVEEWKAEQEKRRQQAAEAMKAFEDDE